ncbi:hypothetical protein VCRA2123O443_40031 [Vibrio crassostreae]|nr:hypothetical protein VCRA2110O182_40308 [Vibrio crassostreae]CAK2348886.1 hypothetical protein VCRA2111O408_40310 [Vibrio crassostreae]CAK2350877.1 hypothetical protein VCRA211O406_30031 [Vibrio crassostreae]CAK3389534.1 hypothetical protein VCRA2123O443_40031 [Vibrio crassostreae]
MLHHRNITTTGVWSHNSPYPIGGSDSYTYSMRVIKKIKKLIPYALNYNLQNSSGPSYCVHFFASNIDLLSIFAAKTTC